MTTATHADMANLSELHALLDCVQVDGTITGLDECSHDSTLGDVLYGVLRSHEQLLEACKAVLRYNEDRPVSSPRVIPPDITTPIRDAIRAAASK